MRKPGDHHAAPRPPSFHRAARGAARGRREPVGVGGRAAADRGGPRRRRGGRPRASRRGSGRRRARRDGATALHWAAYLDDATAAGLLIDAGADVGAANRAGVTPLSLAAAGAGAALVERLLQAGADPDERLPGGETPLMMAARAGRTAVIDVLLDHGADVNAAEERRGTTALMWAAANERSGRRPPARRARRRRLRPFEDGADGPGAVPGPDRARPHRGRAAGRGSGGRPRPHRGSQRRAAADAAGSGCRRRRGRSGRRRSKRRPTWTPGAPPAPVMRVHRRRAGRVAVPAPSRGASPHSSSRHGRATSSRRACSSTQERT